MALKMATEKIILDYEVELNSLRKEIGELRTLMKGAENSSKKAATETTKGFNQAALSVDKLGKTAERAGKGVAGSFDNATRSVSNLDKAATNASSGGLNKRFGELNTTVSKTPQLLNNIGKSASGLSVGIGQLAATMGVAFGIQQVVQFGKASAEAFIDAEKNAQLLLFALKGNEQAQERLMNQASRIQNTTIYDDDTIQQAQTFLANQGRTEKQIMKVIDAAVQLSAVTGVDLNTAVMQLDATFEGNIGRMAKLDSGFKDLTKEQLANGAAADLLIEKYKGTAEAMGDTTAGKVAKLKNQFGELQETIGGEMLTVLGQAVDGFEMLSSGNILGGLDKIQLAFEKVTFFINYIPTPINQITRGVREFRDTLTSLGEGDYLGALQNYFEGIGNIISFGMLGAVQDMIGGTEDLTDKTTGYEKAILGVLTATEKELEEKRKLIEAQNGNVEAFDRYVASVRQSQIKQTFEELSGVLAITEKKYKELTDISDKYNRSAAITSSLILDIKNATEEDLDVAFKKFNGTLNVTREDFDKYVNTVKGIKPLQDGIAESTEKMVGPYDALNNKLGDINKKILDYIALGKDATLLDRQRKEVQDEINKIQEENNRLLGLHNTISVDTKNINEEVVKTYDELREAAYKALEPIRQMPFTLSEVLNSSKKTKDSISDLEKSLKEFSDIAGALGQLGDALSGALTQIFGKAAEDSAVFAGFQKAIAIFTITMKSAEAIASGIASIASGDPTKIISGIAGIVAGVGNLIGGLISQIQGEQVPKAPSFYVGTHDTGDGGNLDSKGGFAAILHPKEAVIPEHANTAVPGLAKAWIEGDLDRFIMTKYLPQYIEDNIRKEGGKEIYNTNFDDGNMTDRLDENTAATMQTNIILNKMLRKNKNPWAC